MTQYEKFLQDSNISVMEWPAKSPDLNLIEIVWGVLARRVYKNCRQFNDVEELESSVVQEWNNLLAEYLQKLLKSMPKRCVEVLNNQGKT